MNDESKTTLSDIKDNELEADITERLDWKKGSKVLIYCESVGAFVAGTIDEINMNDDKEGLKVKYDGGRKVKVVDRWAKDIKIYSYHIMNFIEANKGKLIDMELFDVANHKHNAPMDRLKRVTLISRFYAQWINHKKQSENISVFDMINTQFTESYNFQHFLSDFCCLMQTKHLLAEEVVTNDDDACNADSCLSIRRNHRDREYLRNNDTKRNQLYLVQQAVKNNEDITREIACQQILDSCHYFIHHTIHIQNATLHRMYNVDHDNNDFDKICDDKYTQNVAKHLENIRKSSIRYRTMEQQPINDKFMTTNDTNRITKQVAQCNENMTPTKSPTTTTCFIDRFLFEIKHSALSKIDMIQLYDMLREEDYDSESIVLDLEESGASNLFEIVSTQSAFGKLTNKVLVERQVSASLYSAGYRYFYWEYYKDNEAERTVIFGQTIGDFNAGYKLKDWYIAPKYSDFKQELLYNRIMNFSLNQYETTLEKASNKLRAWIHADGESVRCKVSAWEMYYDIRKDDAMSLQHVLALLFYTNFSAQCFELSATYRKCNEYESDFDLKQRHREYHHWAKLLRECVECFGTTMEESKIKVFYHGISKSMIFNSSSVRLCGPVSTTASFNVAINIFGADGIVLDITRRNVTQYYFNCPYWSDFANEDEKLYIGGLVHFEFATIRDISNKLNYWCYVQVLTMFHFMSEGWQFKKQIKKWHYKALKVLMKEEIEGKVLQGVESQVPDYVLKLWHHFLCNIHNVEINWKYMQMQQSNTGQRYGYKIFSPKFVLKKWTSLDFRAFLRILPNLQSISLYNWNKKEQFTPTIGLSDVFTKHLIESIDIIHNSATLRTTFKEFNIVLPNNEEIHLKIYIKKHQDYFKNRGWKMTQKEFHSVFHQEFKGCAETLCIQRL